MINLNRIMAYYTVVAFAVGIACALAYSIYNSINTAVENRPQRYDRNRRRRQEDIDIEPDEPTSPTDRVSRYCGVCDNPVHSNLQLSCGHQFHRSCFQKTENCDNCPNCDTPLNGTELWQLFENEYSVCSICLCPTDQGSYVLSCGHEFHCACAVNMVQYEERCPNCREELPDSDVRGIAAYKRYFH